MNIDIKYIKRKGKLVPIKIVFNGNDYTVYDTSKKKIVMKKYFSMSGVKKDFKFVE